MSADTRGLVSELVAALLEERFARRRGIGVLVEDMPALDASVLLKCLANMKPLPRVALLGLATVPAHPKGIIVSTDSSQANRWRNDAEAKTKPTATIVLGQSSKVNSLRTTLDLVGPKQLRDATVGAARDRLDTPERRAFWGAVAGQPAVSLDCLLQFVQATAEAKTDSALLEVEPSVVYLLGLLKQRALSTATGLAKAKAALRRNLELVDRLRDLSAQDRKVLSHADSLSPDSVGGQVLRFSRTKALEDLKGLTFEDVLEVLKPKKKTERKEPVAQKATLEGDSLALEMMLDDARGLGAAAQRFEKQVAPDGEGEIDADDVVVGTRTVTPRLRAGTTQAITGFVGSLCDEENWGGIITAEGAADIVSALRLAAAADVDRLPFRPADDRGVRGLLAMVVKRGIGRSALDAWDRLAGLRRKLLKHHSSLADHPLLVLSGSEDVREVVKELIAAHGAALKAIAAAADEVKDSSPETAKALRARALVADVVFIKLKQDELTAVLNPTHPFHLWRWLTMWQLIKDNRVELNDLGSDTLKPLITDPPPVSPHIVLSAFALEEQLTKTRSFVAAGSVGALPMFAEPGARQAVHFRARALAQIAERLLRVMPHASLGLRVFLVDPPSVAGVLEFLLDLRSTIDGEAAVPIHVTVARTRAVGEASDEEQEQLEGFARDLREARGSLRVAPVCKSLQDVAAQLKRDPAHLCAVFDPGESKDMKLGVTTPPMLSPLVLPRVYHYDELADRLDVMAAGTATEFESYQQLFCEVTDTKLNDFLGRRSGASRVSQQLVSLTVDSTWLTVIDQGLEPTLAVRGADRIDSRSDGSRDLITFTAHSEVVEDLVKDALRQVGLKATEETVKRARRELLALSGEALLWLARQKVAVDSADPRVAKGLFGVIAAVRWYQAIHPDSLVVSLDDDLSRRWILGAGHDDRHGDLLFVRADKGGIAVDAVEVKAHEEAPVNMFGSTIEGTAVTQIDQTLATMKRITQRSTASMVDLARQAVLRDQLYRAVAARPYDQDKRKRLVNMVESLFRDGAMALTGVVVHVTIASGRGHQAPTEPRYYTSLAGNSIGYAELVESEILGPSEPSEDREPGVVAPKRGRPSSAGKSVARVDERTPDPEPKRVSPPEPARTASELRVFIGTAHDGSEVYWEPSRRDNPLNNFGLLVTGDSGSGKTQVLRAIIADVARAGFPVCVFDFKNDYSTPDFVSPLGMRVHDVDAKGLPFNPLELVADADGNVQPIRLIHTVVDILRRIFALGTQQEVVLRQAISAAFEGVGIDPKARKPLGSLPKAPSFQRVVDILTESEDARSGALLNRLSPLFDLNLFPASEAAEPFEHVLRDRIVLDLHSLPNDAIKAALAEFLIVRLHAHMLRGEQPRRLTRLLVLDEAWRVAQSERLQELAREGRAFGVGIAIGTQFPGDMPDTLGGSLATQLLLKNGEADHRKAVARTLSGSSSGPAAQSVIKLIDRLKTHEGFFRNQQYVPYALVETLPHYKRVAPSAANRTAVPVADVEDDDDELES